MGIGFAGGDISIAAWIQSLEEDKDDSGQDNDNLAAIMAFLQTTYIAMYALFSPTLGLYADKVFKSHGDMHEVVQNIACLLFTIIAAITFAATFVPRGACAWNDGIQKRWSTK